MRKRLFVGLMILIFSLTGCNNKEGQEIDEKLSSLHSRFYMG